MAAWLRYNTVVKYLPVAGALLVAVVFVFIGTHTSKLACDRQSCTYNDTSFRVELQVDAWDRTRLLEDLSRTFAEAGINIIEARCTVSHPMVKNRFVVEVGDTAALRACVGRLRNVESVFDAYRVTPGS